MEEIMRLKEKRDYYIPSMVNSNQIDAIILPKNKQNTIISICFLPYYLLINNLIVSQSVE